MSIPASVAAKLNEQITHELSASQAYLAIACQFADLGLRALEKKFRAQADEERGHALKILDYVLEVGTKVTLAPLPAPTPGYPTVLAAIQAAVAHETKVTRQIHDIVALAGRENDYATHQFMQWFVSEQVEEMASMSQLEQVAKMAGENLLHLDSYVYRMAEKD